MKASTLTAVALTLFMLLLVFAAAFIFLFQGQLALRDNVVEAEATLESLQQNEARLRIEAAAAQETVTASEQLRATSAANEALLESQLVQSEQERDLLQTQLDDTTAELQSARATTEFYMESGPQITLIEPQATSQAVAGQPVPLLIVASDPAGVKTVTVSVGRELLDTPVTPQPSVIVAQEWVPERAGTAILSISAVNDNGVTSKTSITTILVSEPTAVATPTATPEPAP